MPILRRYAFREVLFPTILSAAALTFVILIVTRPPWSRDERLILMLMKLFLRPELPKSEVAGILLLTLPTILMFILPMALLVGSIVGVGRMALDLEVRAMQTSGLNLLSVFFPVLLLGAVLSGTTAVLSWSAEPNWVAESVTRGGRLLLSEFSNLEPGRVYGDILGGRGGANLHFERRDGERGGMNGVTLLMDRAKFGGKDEDASRKLKDKIAKVKQLEREGALTREQADRMEFDLKIERKQEQPVLVFAESARFNSDPAASTIQLELENGTLHMADVGGARGLKAASAAGPAGLDESAFFEEPSPDAAAAPPAIEQDYCVLSFDRLTKSESFGAGDVKKNRRAKTIPELNAVARDRKAKDKVRNEARATVFERFSSALACLVFAMVGLPLAIWVKPTGRAAGGALAMVIILVYHMIMRSGVTMTGSGKAIGPFVIMLPNLLFGGLGVLLWTRAVRR